MLRPVLLLLLLAPLVGQAALYKWVDANGVTHYSETPPQNGKAATLNVRAGTANGTAASQEDWSAKEADFQRRKMDAVTQERDQANRKQQCAEARDHLARMKEASRIYQVNADGQRVYLDDQSAAASIASLEAVISKNCS